MSSLPEDGGGMPLRTRILLGLVIGAVVGIAVNLTVGSDHAVVQWVNMYVAGPVGQVFLNTLFMIVMPLVFASISLGVSGLGDVRKLGRVGGKTMGYFVATTAAAATLGLIMVQIFRPGSGLPQEVQDDLMATFGEGARATAAVAEQGGFGIHTIVNIVTRNPVRSAADGDMLGVIFFALMVGIAITLIERQKVQPLIDVLVGVQEVVIKIVGIAMRFAPYAVTALIFGMTSRFGLPLLKPLGVYVAVVLGALLLHVAITLSAIVRVYLGMSALDFFRRSRTAIVTAFSTSSSAATLPAALETSVTQLGVPRHIGGFVLPLGNTMCMNGTSLFEGITVIFLCQVFGVDLSLGQMIIVMIMAVITAIGAAGVPGGSIPLLVGIAAMFGVPGEAIAIVLGVDRILDMSRTTVNIAGDLTAAAVIAKSEGVWDKSMLPPNG